MADRPPTSPADFLRGLEGRRVLVTAGAGGIGLSITETLVALGARVVVCDVSEAALDAIGGRVAAAIRADVSAEADVDALFEATATALGGLDALVNNAGIAGPIGGVEEIAPADWRRCLDVGLTGQFLCARRAVPMLKAAGGGSIVSMSSAAGRFGYAFRTPYAAAKWGVIGFTLVPRQGARSRRHPGQRHPSGHHRGSALEGVIANRAEQLGLTHDEMKTRYLESVSLRRMTSPWDVAAAVAFLLSDAAANVSGQSLGVDGNVEAL